MTLHALKKYLQLWRHFFLLSETSIRSNSLDNKPSSIPNLTALPFTYIHIVELYFF